MRILQARRATAVLATLTLLGTANLPSAEAESTALVMGGTAQSTPSEWQMENALDGILAGSTLVPVTTPAEWWPLVGALPWDDSVAEGEQSLLDAIAATDGSIIVFGYSQSAYIASLAAQSLAATTGAPGPGQITFILTANPGRPGGFLSLLPHGTNILGTTYTGGLQPASPYDVIDVAYEYDGIARYPKNPLRVLAGLNAILGAVYFHGGYSKVDLDDIPESDITRVPNDAGGVTSYYLVRQPNLPLLQPLRNLGVDKRFVDGLNTFFTPFVKAAYPSESGRVDAPDAGPENEPAAAATTEDTGKPAVQNDSPSKVSSKASARAADTTPVTAAEATDTAAPESSEPAKTPSRRWHRPGTRSTSPKPRHEPDAVSAPAAKAPDATADPKPDSDATSESGAHEARQSAD